MRRSLYVHLAPGCNDRVVVNRRRPSWSPVICDYVDYGHSEIVSREAFSLLTGLFDLPRFPTIAVLDQNNTITEVVRPPKRRERR